MKKNIVYLFVTTCLLAFSSGYAQVTIEGKISPQEVSFSKNYVQLLFGKSPVLSINASDFVIKKEGNDKPVFGDWNSLKAEGCSAHTNISVAGQNIYHVVIDFKTESDFDIQDLFLQFKFLPQNPSEWSACRTDFHWIPNIKSKPLQIASDHVFRSPVVFMMCGQIGAALIPDLELLPENRPAPYYLDMRFPEGDAPEIVYGISNAKVIPHQFYEKTGQPFAINSGQLKLGFYLIVNDNTSRNDLVRKADEFLWKKFGRSYLGQHEPQTVPFQKYAAYGYEMALKELWVKGGYPNSGGITLSTYFNKEKKKWGGRDYPNDLWFHSWFNNMRTAYGLFKWGEKLGNQEWKEKAVEVRNLLLNSPVDRGFFKTIYDSQKGIWVASGQGGGANVYHLPDNSWTALWLLRFNRDCNFSEKAQKFVMEFANALLFSQHEDGSFPARVFTDSLMPDPVLDKSASEGLSVWLLAEMRLMDLFPKESQKRVDEAIRKGLDHIHQSVLPRQKFEDFELYFSCSAKPLDFYDPVSEMYGQNNLSIQWCAEAFRAGYQLLGNQVDYDDAQYCVDQLCLYQQVWNPPYLSFYAFGGFGTMNTDAEWNDARQAQFAETLSNFYDLTGNREYLERAVAAAKASFTLMVIDENKNVAPFNYKGTDVQFEIHGAMAENYGHCGEDCRSGQSGFHWGTGSALCTSIILENKYGDLYIDTKHKKAVGINGMVIKKEEFSQSNINLTIDKLTNDEYIGKILKSKKAQNIHLKIHNKEVKIGNHNIFEINPE